MGVLIDAVNRQIEQSIYENPSKEAKIKLASTCELIKKIAIIVAIATPILAFFKPYIFGFVAAVAIGLIGYDIFNMADNLGDAAKLSAEGGTPGDSSNFEMLIESTLLTKALYHRVLSGESEVMEPDDLSSFEPESAEL